MSQPTRRAAAVFVFLVGSLSLFLAWRVCNLPDLEGVVRGLCAWRFIVGVVAITLAWGLWRGSGTGT